MRLVRKPRLDPSEEPGSARAEHAEPGSERAEATEPGEPADSLWIADAAAGDPEAFRRLFERHSPSVRRFLRDLGRDGALADEGTQETFVRAHARLGSLRDEQRLRPWLLGIARRVLLEELRRRRPRVAPVDAEPPPSPEAELLVAEQVRVFRAALARLGDERRGVVLLRLDHGLSYDEIAQVMQMSPAKVRNELHRGRQELRDYLAPYWENRS
jgi:RNA polymerase sigma-70 factor, ECF subfamily